MNNVERTGDIDVVLVSLGTPDALSVASIRGFLRRFLSDKRVIEAPRAIWLPILYGIILPFRPFRLKSAYAEIWQKSGGSPLRIIAEQQVAALKKSIASDQRFSDKQVTVLSAMLYDAENLEDLLKTRAQKQHKTIILPLYPQYSATTTGAVYDQVFNAYLSVRDIVDHKVIKQYFSHPHYQQALCDSVKSFWQDQGQGEFLLMSFHGLPKEYTDKGDPYYDQCAATAATLAQGLLLKETECDFSFQSRLGPKEWLQPYTSDQIKKIAAKGVKKLDVVCPSFSADCLETLEEIAIQGQELFQEAGGDSLRLVPSLNATEAHIQLFKQLILEAC